MKQRTLITICMTLGLLLCISIAFNVLQSKQVQPVQGESSPEQPQLTLISSDSLAPQPTAVKWRRAAYDVNELDIDTFPKDQIPLSIHNNNRKDQTLWEVVNGTGEERVLDSSVIARERPLLTLESDPEMKKIDRYDCSGILEIKKLCPDCGERMLTVNVVHEVNNCGHGIFSYANYCEKNDVYIPFMFYTVCGCSIK